MTSSNEEVTHLRGNNTSLCDKQINGVVIEEGILTCPDCAAHALHAIELTTEAERREWRKL